MRKEPAVTESGGGDPDRPASDRPRLDADHVHAIYQRWHTDVRRFLMAITGDAELAEELLQATFGRLVEAGQAARPESMRGWLFKVAHNELRLWKRRAATHARWLGGAASPATAMSPTSGVAGRDAISAKAGMPWITSRLGFTG